MGCMTRAVNQGSRDKNSNLGKGILKWDYRTVLYASTSSQKAIVFQCHSGKDLWDAGRSGDNAAGKPAATGPATERPAVRSGC